MWGERIGNAWRRHGDPIPFVNAMNPMDTSPNTPRLAPQPPDGEGGGSGLASAGSGGSNPVAPRDSGILGRELGGDLLCVGCGYNRRGLSIRGPCPECGMGVRATILAIVDPLASELRPIRWAGLVASGLVMWAAAAAAGALLAWAPHFYDLLRVVGAISGRGYSRPSVGAWLLVCAVISGLGAAAMIRPHAGIARSTIVCSVLAVLMYPLLAWLVWMIGVDQQSGSGWRYASMQWMPTEFAMMLGVGVNLTIAAILLLLRPTARLLVARSLVMRSGRVDRQTMYAMAAAAGLAAMGHALGYAGGEAGWVSAGGGIGPGVRVVGLIFVTLGSTLLTVGLCGGVVDAVRIARAVMMPSPTLRQVIRHGYSTKSGVFTRKEPEHGPRADGGPPPPHGTERTARG